MSFRKNLEHLRKGKNLSQEDLAFKLGVSRQAVSKWESGGTYPETSKMLAMCNLFECSLDDLMQEDIAENQKEAKKKYAVDDLIREITGLINRTSTMISRMTFRSLLKFGFEIFVLFMIMLILKVPFDHAYSLGEGVFVNFGYKIGSLLSSIWRLVVEGVYFISATILFVYIYKIRFLDKFDVGGSHQEIKKIEKTNYKEISSLDHDAKVDEKLVQVKSGTDVGFFELLGKLAILSIKAFVIFIFPLISFAFIGSIGGFVIGISLVFNQVVYIGALLFTISFACFSALMIYVSFNFVLDRRLAWEKAFVAFLTSIIGFGVSIGIGTIELNQLTIVAQDRVDATREIVVEEFEMIEDLDLSPFWYNAEFVLDETLTDSVRIEVYYEDTFSSAIIEKYENQIFATVSNETVSMSKLYQLLVNDLRNGTIYLNDGTLFNGKIKLYTNSENYTVLQENVHEIVTRFQEPLNECDCVDDSETESTPENDDQITVE